MIGTLKDFYASLVQASLVQASLVMSRYVQSSLLNSSQGLFVPSVLGTHGPWFVMSGLVWSCLVWSCLVKSCWVISSQFKAHLCCGFPQHTWFLSGHAESCCVPSNSGELGLVTFSRLLSRQVESRRVNASQGSFVQGKIPAHISRSESSRVASGPVRSGQVGSCHVLSSQGSFAPGCFWEHMVLVSSRRVKSC